VSAIRIFCFEGHSASRCSITSKKFFWKSPLGGPCKHFGGAELGFYGTECPLSMILDLCIWESAYRSSFHSNCQRHCSLCARFSNITCQTDMVYISSLSKGSHCRSYYRAAKHCLNGVWIASSTSSLPSTKMRQEHQRQSLGRLSFHLKQCFATFEKTVHTLLFHKSFIRTTK